MGLGDYEDQVWTCTCGKSFASREDRLNCCEPSKGITLAEQLFRDVDVRLRKPEERLYRICESIFDEYDISLHRLTWDWYDHSVEIYLDTNSPPEKPDLTRLWAAGFRLVWVHPFRCTDFKTGSRDHVNCKCPARRP